MSLYCNLECFDSAICDFCRFFIFSEGLCIKFDGERDPLDICYDFECRVAYKNRGEKNGR